MKKEYKISENIDYRQIEEFVNDYKKELENSPISNNFTIRFEIDYDIENENDEKGLIDPLFLSYLVLFLTDFQDVKVTFELNGRLTQSRAYSLLTQLEHYIEFFKLQDRIILNGNYLITDTGELENLKLRNVLSHAQTFIPPSYIIDSSSIDYYFKSNYVIQNQKIKNLLSDYKNKIIQLIKEKGFEKKDRNSKGAESYIENLQLDKFSLFELTLYLLLINKNTYEKLKGKGITNKVSHERRKENIARFHHYTQYVKEIAKGLKELAKNITEHSGHKGVITARVFSKKKLISLKGEDSIEAEFFKIREEDFFIDINIIDFGKDTVKDKYIENLRTHKNLATKLSINNLDNDIEIIESFEYKDFFLINKHFFKLQHQQNKLISRYGLHHFTNIIYNKLKGFIKTSSQGEGVIIFKDKNNKDDIRDVNKNHSVYLPKRGTAYNCIIPLKSSFIEEKITIEKTDKKRGNVDSIQTITELSNYIILPLDKENSTNKTPIYKFPYKSISETLKQKHKELKNKKYLYIYYLYDTIISIAHEKKNDILLINAEDIFINDEHDWTKLLSALNKDFNDIIIYNSDKDNIKTIKDLRKNYEIYYNKNIEKQKSAFDEFSFWSNDGRVLFYSKKENDNIKEKNRRYYRYGATILMGESVKEYNYVNKSIWRHHYSFNEKEGFFSNIPTNLLSPKENLYGSKLFIDGKLKYFELIIEIEESNGRLSLFEKSVQYSLNKEYSDKNNESNNRGYKISNTHFRLGSKIHISDFYYAKRLFQNSFFTTPLAYRLTEYICNNVDLSNNQKISIIGYDPYSDFIASTVRNILNKRNKNLQVKNFIISKDGDLSRDYKNLYSNTIIIVPIASTFSTSIKIKKDIDRIIKLYNYNKVYKEIIRVVKDKYLNIPVLNLFYKNLSTHETIEDSVKFTELYFSKQTDVSKNIENDVIDKLLKSFKKEQNVLAFLNVLLVGHKEKVDEDTYQYFDDFEGNQISVFSNKIFEEFNWKSLNNSAKIIDVTKFNGEEKPTKQKYFIPLYSNWHKAQSCELCFPITNNLLSEKCLIETNPASVTPQVIFGYPKVKITNPLGKKLLSYKGSLLYGNLKRNNNKYLFFTKAGTIINKTTKNKKIIVNWLKSIRNNVFASNENDKIVLVTPSSNTKSNFIDIVNEVIFDYTANSIIISLDEEYIENSESLYSDALYQAEKVIYVDDVLITNKSFTKVNHIIKYIRKKTASNKGIDYCISLINRMSYDVEDNLISELSNKESLYYLTKLNVPSIEEPNNIFPLQKERKRYKFLSNISSLDAVRQRFHSKREQLRPIDLNNLSELENEKYNRIDDDNHHKNKKLFQLLVLDAFYSIFRYKIESLPQKKQLIGVYNIDEKIKSFFENDLNKLISINSSYEKLSLYIREKLNQKHNSIVEHKNIITDYQSNLNCVILKIICGTPLIYYKNIKESAFKWILNNLIILTDEIKKLEENSKFDEISFLFIKDNKYSKIETLKFLLKRAVQLQSNFIISEKFFETLKILIPIIKNNEQEIIRINKETKEIRIATNLKKQSVLKLFYEEEDGNEKPLFFEITSKDLIYYIISLTQELIYEHETKSLKLDEIITRYINLDNINYQNNTENGNFLHLLRLLKLENTELFYKFYKYYNQDKGKYSYEKKLIAYKSDPKYLLASKLIDNRNDKDDLIIKYIKVNELLENKENETFLTANVNNNLKDFIEKEILNHIVNIIGKEKVAEAFLTVNYNKIRKNIKETDIFIFKHAKPKDESNYESIGNSIALNHDNLDSSITLKMFNGIKASNHNDKNTLELSNLEIFKNKKGLHVRDGLNITKEKLKLFSEITTLSGKNEFNILLIRISDFYKSTSNSEKNKLYSQGVLTLHLKEGKRVDENRLRILLLLRKSLSKFLNQGISSKMYAELIKFEQKLDSQRKLRHGVGGYLGSQFSIISKFEGIEALLDSKDDFEDINDSLEANERGMIKYASNDFWEFNILNNLIISQISVNPDKITEKKILFPDYLEQLIKIIFSSKRIGKNSSSTLPNMDISFEPFETYIILIDSIIPELILNQKKYGENWTIKAFENSKFINIEFFNIIRSIGNGFGIKLIKSTIKKLDNIDIIITEQCNSYQTKIIITK